VKKRTDPWKLTNRWESSKVYKHLEKPEVGEGQVCLEVDRMGKPFYFFRVRMPCPQEWAAKIHAQETGEDKDGDLQGEIPWTRPRR